MAQHSLFSALEAGTTVVTGSDRLARHLLDRFSVNQLQIGRSTWASPRVLSWQAFLNDLADHWLLDQADAPKRLGAAAAATLWERMVLESSPVPILQPAATARSLQEAWQSLHAAMLDETAVRPETADSRAFIDWAGHYRRYCQQAGLIDPAGLPDLLSRHLASGKPANTGRLLLTGFLELTAQQQNFLAAWEAAGGEWQLVDPLGDSSRGRSTVAEFANTDEECVAVAGWAQKILSAESTAQIGIVVPDLTVMRPRIERQLIRYLLPTSRITANDDHPPFNFSAGISLRNYAMIRDGLIALSLGEGIDYRDAGRLLRSPFFGTEAERQSELPQLERALRKSGGHSFDIRFVAQLAMRHAPGLSRRLERLLSLRAKQSTRRGTSHWARSFSDELKLLGWSQGRPLNSKEYQVREAWYGLLGEFSSLERVLKSVDRSRALSVLGRLASERVFQPRTDFGPIQVLGLLETIGLQFDHLWVMGLNDNNWPQSARPNPFLPVRLQREHGMQHASAQKEREFAISLMSLLERGAPNVTFSYPKTEQDRKLRPSPLLAGFPKEDIAAAFKDPLTARMIGNTQLASFTDDIAPALGSNELQLGGTTVIKDMAACPFRAFAKTRLRAKEELHPDSGLNAAERGDLLHALLKGVWDELEDKQALSRLSEKQRGKLVRRHIDQLLNKRYGSNKSLSKTFLDAEAQRLLRLVLQWLVIEDARSKFKVIGREVAVELEIGPLTLTGRIDRIDQLDDGGEVLIDYKTGRVSINDWVGERPDAPQLPLYAVNRDTFPDVVAFARIKNGENRFEGLAVEEELLVDATIFKEWKNCPDGLEKWTDLEQYWRVNLAELGRQFAAGVAAVDPKIANKSCMYCHLSTLCRIDEKSQSRRGFSGETDDE